MTVYPEAAVRGVGDGQFEHAWHRQPIRGLRSCERPGLAARLEIHHTPKHGSWLNMAETELSILSRQCLDRRIDSKELLTHEVAAWEQDRNAKPARRSTGRFTTADARVKLKRLYPSIQA